MSRKDIQKEACWTICNIVCGGSMQQVKSLIHRYVWLSVVTQNDKDAFYNDLLKIARTTLSSKLVNSDSEDRLLMIIMDTLDRLLAVGEGKEGHA